MVKNGSRKKQQQKLKKALSNWNPRSRRVELLRTNKQSGEKSPHSLKNENKIKGVKK